MSFFDLLPLIYAPARSGDQLLRLDFTKDFMGG